MTGCVLGSAVFVGLLAGAASAEETKRVFLRFDGDAKKVARLESLAARFEASVLEVSGYEVAGTAEMEQVYADCAVETGTDAETRRECQLRAANRLMVQHVIEISVAEASSEQWELQLAVWNPETNGKVHAAVVDLEASSLEEAAREGFPLLAAHYLCFEGHPAQCQEVGRASEPTAVATATAVTTPATTAPHSTTCPPGQARFGESCLVDTDADAIVDVADKCPEAAESHDGFEDDDGCPELDADRDFVADDVDRCPTHAEDLDGYEDEDGCREEHDYYMVAGWSSGATGLAAIGAGVACWFAYESSIKTVETTNLSGETESITYGTESLQNTSIGLLAGGGALLIAGTVLLLLPDELPDLDLAVAAEQAALRWTLSF